MLYSYKTQIEALYMSQRYVRPTFMRTMLLTAADLELEAGLNCAKSSNSGTYFERVFEALGTLSDTCVGNLLMGALYPFLPGWVGYSRCGRSRARQFSNARFGRGRQQMRVQ